ncbi:MAG: hypothetical protein OXT67_04970 [Zetaproteobacteria bacterium]|nr:hypothetical protein [Zetaproteobacteria bacterium]
MAHTAYEIGIGPLHARDFIHTCKRLANTKVIYLGTAGIFGSFTEVTLRGVHTSIWAPCAERMGEAKSFDHLHPAVHFDTTAPMLPSTTCLCSTSISYNTKLPPHITSLFEGPFIENMELHALADILHVHCQDTLIVMAITNAVGHTGSTQWQQNWRVAAEKSAEYIGKVIC